MIFYQLFCFNTYFINHVLAFILYKGKKYKQAKTRKRRNQKKTPTPKTKVGKNQTNNQVVDKHFKFNEQILEASVLYGLQEISILSKIKLDVFQLLTLFFISYLLFLRDNSCLYNRTQLLHCKRNALHYYRSIIPLYRAFFSNKN